jgi:hypothetical protein
MTRISLGLADDLANGIIAKPLPLLLGAFLGALPILTIWLLSLLG